MFEESAEAPAVVLAERSLGAKVGRDGIGMRAGGYFAAAEGCVFRRATPNRATPTCTAPLQAGCLIRVLLDNWRWVSRLWIVAVVIAVVGAYRPITKCGDAGPYGRAGEEVPRTT